MVYTKEIFQESGSAENTKRVISAYTKKDFTLLEKLNVFAEKKKLLRSFG